MKVSIVPRGIAALGYAQYLPKEQFLYQTDQLLDEMCMALGGRAAEEIIFGPEIIGSGAAGDIQQVTNLARAMVTQMGYSDKLGRVRYTGNQEEVFLGRSVTQTQSVSEEVAQKIDKEIRKLVDEGYNKAKQILTDKVDDLHKIAKALITYETLTGQEIENIVNKNLYPKKDIEQKCNEVLSYVSDEFKIDPTIIANKRDMEIFIISNQKARFMKGWRYQIFGKLVQ